MRAGGTSPLDLVLFAGMSPVPSETTADSNLEKVDLKDDSDDASIEIVRAGAGVDSEHALSPNTLPKSGARSLFVDGIKVNVDPNVPVLAEGDTEARWTWLDLFKRKKSKPVYDWHAIATRPSVYDDPVLAPHYTPMYV